MKFYDELPEPYRDAVYNEVELHLSFMDRIRLLFGASLTVKVQTLVENPVGKHFGESEAVIGPVFRKRRAPMGFVTSEEGK